MSEIIPTNDAAVELNGDTEQKSMNGEVEDAKSPPSVEEKTADSLTDSSGNKKTAAGASSSTAVTSTPTANNTNRSKKRKKPPRDATAPKQPLTGYFRFLNDRREKVRTDNPTFGFADITKLLAAEWSSLPAEQKQQYLSAAELDKERYNREFSDYKQTEAYRLFSERQSTEKLNESKKERNGNDTAEQIVS